MTQIAVNMLVRHCSCLNVYSNHQWILLHHGVTRWHNLTFVRLSYHKMVQPLFCQALIPQDGITSLCSGSYATRWHNLSLVMLSNNKMAQLTFGQALIWQDGTTSLWLDSYRITSNFTIIHGLFSLNVGLFSSDLKFCACSTHPSHLRVPYLLNRTPSKFFHLLIKRILNPLRVWSVVYQHNSLHNKMVLQMLTLKPNSKILNCNIFKWCLQLLHLSPMRIMIKFPLFPIIQNIQKMHIC